MPQPVYYHAGKAQMINVAGLPLGLFENASYEEIMINASPGDIFVFSSDSIMDANNAKDDQFGRVRIERVIVKNCNRSAQQIVDALFQATAKFSNGAPMFDDQTVVVLKVK